MDRDDNGSMLLSGALEERPETAEVVMRKKEGSQFMFVLNFQAKEIFYEVKKPARMLYSGEIVSGICTLPAYETAVYEIL